MRRHAVQAATDEDGPIHLAQRLVGPYVHVEQGRPGGTPNASCRSSPTCALNGRGSRSTRTAGPMIVRGVVVEAPGPGVQFDLPGRFDRTGAKTFGP